MTFKGKFQAVLVLLASFILVGSVAGQSSPDLKKLFGSQTKLVQMALDSSLFIVRQDYVLQDTSSGAPVNFGRAGNNYFGRSYSLGVIAGGDLYISGMTSTPWLRDTNYTEFAMNAEYIPSLSTIALRTYSGDSFSDLPLEMVVTHDEFSGFHKLTGLDYGDGLSIYVSESSTVEGLYLNVTSKQEFDIDESQKPHLSTSFSDIQVVGDRVEHNLSSSRNRLPRLGGLFLVPQYSTGSINFGLLGLVNRDKGELHIVQLPVEKLEAVEAVNDSASLIFKIVHDDGFALSGVILSVNGRNYESDEDGIVRVTQSDPNEILMAKLNGVNAGCGRTGQIVEVRCRYSKGMYLPAKKVKCP